MTTAHRAASAVLVLLTGIAGLTGLTACSVPEEDVALDSPAVEPSESAEVRTDPTPKATPSASATPTVAAAPRPKPNPTPTVVVRTVVETRTIRFGVRTVRDADLAKGVRRVRTQGRDGVERLTYEVTYVDGRRTDRDLVGRKITRRPVTQVVVIGTRVDKPRCDPNYSGCVPIASDVDCAGGSGNGPAYVQGPVRVIGTDIYDLDRDGDGIACDT